MEIPGRKIRGEAAVAGIGQSAFYRPGKSPDSEFSLALDAILQATADAGIDARDIDGFVSYCDDRNTSLRILASLGVRECRWSTMQWGGGGGGTAGAVQQAAAAVAAGFADTIVVYRGLAQGQFGRYGQSGYGRPRGSNHWMTYGMLVPAQMFAPRINRFFYETGISPDTQRAIALTCYKHAQNNPNAVMYGRPLTKAGYDASRWIVEPLRLYDCCQENDAAAALIVTTAERARDLQARPAYVLAAAQGTGHRGGAFFEGIFDGPSFPSAETRSLANQLFGLAGLRPSDLDVAQFYENFTGCVVMAMLEHGVCDVDNANEFITEDNLTLGGELPINTSGGNLAEAYVHGLGHHLEAVRQIRGTAINQVPDARTALVTGGPVSPPSSSIIYCGEGVLS